MPEPTSAIPMAALRQLVSMAQAAASPVTLVKHGRREDRAMAYDRFLKACAGAVRNRSTTDGVAEVWSTWQAVNLRSAKKVRKAASDLVDRVYATADAGALGEGQRWIFDAEEQDYLPRTDLEEEFGVDLSKDEEVLFMHAMRSFVEVARMDLLERWWHWPMPGPLRRRYLASR
ncbi:hypothetical protein [Streptomyces californicus]|uniref:hypothetical protein n=1 Tax=Streptomyces californicus TaxID=67351 RepID=UPI00379064EB